MSRLQELIDELCPNGVEYFCLGDVCDIKGRIGFRGYTRQDQVEEGNGAISLSPSNIVNGEIKYEKCTFISWEKYDESPEIQVAIGDIIFGKTASVGKTALVKFLPEKATINPQLVVLKNIKCDSSYLSYVLKTKQFQEKVNKIKGLGTVPTISQKDFERLTLPVPPLEVQREIVRVLDSFTLLTDELTDKLANELTARKKQYEYYKHKLLFDNSGNTVVLEDVAYYSKDRVEAEKLDEQTYVGVDNLLQNCVGKVASTHVPTEGRLTGYKKNDILIGNIRPYLRKIWFADNNGGTNGDVLDIRVKDETFINPRYLYYILSSEKFFNYDNNNAKGAKMPRGDKDAIMRFSFSVPTINEQMRIISILDNFYVISNDVNKGIPAEIEARHKQYEYYRDKLLSFKELEA